MNIKQLAASYLRYIGPNFIADNAPAILRTFWKASKFEPRILNEVFEILACGGSVDVPPTVQLLERAVITPSVLPICDGLLASRQPPKTMDTLLRNAYLIELGEAKVSVQKFLQEELDKY